MQRIGPAGKESFIAARTGGFGFAAVALAGPQNIRYAVELASRQRDAGVDRADLEQARWRYARPDVMKVVRDGKPVPDGAVRVMTIHPPKFDADGTPAKTPTAGS